jgi:hypothetical protein
MGKGFPKGFEGGQSKNEIAQGTLMNNQDGLDAGYFPRAGRNHRFSSSGLGYFLQTFSNMFIIGCDLEDLQIFPSCLFPPFLILVEDTQIDPRQEVARVDTKGLLQFKDGLPEIHLRTVDIGADQHSPDIGLNHKIFF